MIESTQITNRCKTPPWDHEGKTDSPSSLGSPIEVIDKIDDLSSQTPPLGLEHVITPLFTETEVTSLVMARDNLQTALDLPNSLKDTLYESLCLVFQNWPAWGAIPGGVKTTYKEIGIEYSQSLNAVTLTINGHRVDVESLFIQNPPGSALSLQEFKKEHQFIIQNKVRLAEENRNLKKTAEEEGFIESEIYCPSRHNAAEGEPRHYPKRTLIFTANRTYMLFNKIFLGQEIAKGGFKKLSLAIELETGLPVVSASMTLTGKNEANTKVNEKNFFSELVFGKLFKGHRDYVQMLGVVEYYSPKRGTNKARILYELLQGQDLYKTIFFPEGFSLSIEERYFIAKELLRIISDLHEMDIAHCDIKVDNFFITRNPEWILEQIKVIDLGSFTYEYEDLLCLPGTPEYRAPEYRRLTPRYGAAAPPSPETLRPISRKKADVWSLGVTICQIIGRPLEGFIQPIYVANEARTAEIIGIPEESPPVGTIEHLVWRMLQANPEERISMIEANEMIQTIL